MKNKKIIIAIVVAALVLIAGLVSYFVFFKQDKYTTLTFAEKQWIENNKNKHNIWGKKPRIANKPSKTPSQIKATTHVDAFNVCNKFLTKSPSNPVIDVNKFVKITPGELIPASV